MSEDQEPASPAGGTGSILRGDAALGPWMQYLEGLAPPVEPVVLPEGTALEEALNTLAIPEEDRPTLLTCRARIETDQELRWLLERSVEVLRRHIGALVSPLAFPALPAALGEVARYFFPWVYIAILPGTLAASRQRGIPYDVMSATMADVGRHFLIHRAQYGTGGMSGQDWLMLHPRGVIFQLGRLQVERGILGGRTSAGIRAAGVAAEKGEPVLSVHIPSFMGPFPPDACNDSFARARSFFARHFPEETYRFAVCHSWLLDPQLADYLPPSSNIVAFQRRFRLAYTPDANDRTTLEFVFRTPDRPLDDLPQRTTLERAVVAHLRSGRHWHGGAGWLPLGAGSG